MQKQTNETHLEPLAEGEDSRLEAAAISIAVSLKRIADTIDWLGSLAEGEINRNLGR